MNIPSFHGPPRQPAGWRGGPWKQGDVVRGRLPRAAFAALFCPGLLSPCPSGAADGASWCRLIMRMTSPNKPAAPNPAITSRLHGGHHWRGVGDAGRSASAASPGSFR